MLRQRNITVEGDMIVKGIMKDKGFYKYLRTKISGLDRLYSPCESRQVVRNSACFVAFAIQNNQQNISHDIETSRFTWESILDSFKQLTTEGGHCILFTWTQFLSSEYYKPSTITHNLDYIKLAIDWVTDVHHIPYSLALFQYRKSLRSKYSKMTKRVRNKVNKFEKKVKDGTYPEQGLPQVIRAIRACYKEYLEWADDLKTEKVQFSWRMNNLYCGCLYASIFAYGAQGRTKAVEELDYNEFEECWKLNKPIASTKFKTSKKYGVQIITIPEGVGKLLMKSYYEIVRPLARNYLITKQIRLPKKGIYENKILLFYLINY